MGFLLSLSGACLCVPVGLEVCQGVFQPLTQWQPMTPPMTLIRDKQQLTEWIDGYRFSKELIRFLASSLVLYKFCILEITDTPNLMRAEAI